MSNPSPSEQIEELAAGYVLDDLSPEEAELLEQALRDHPELNTRANFLQDAFTALPYDLPEAVPPPHLWANILQAAQAADHPVLTVVEPLRQMPRIAWVRLAGGLAALVAIALGLDNLRLRQELQLARQTDPERVATILQRPNSRLVALRASNTSEAVGTLLFTPGKWQEVVLSLQNLPPLPPGEIYRLWLTLNNGQVLPCGEFNTNAQKSVFIKLNPPKTPPAGTKTTGMFVTVNTTDSPLEPTGPRIMSGVL